MPKAKLIYDDSEKNMDMFYATKIAIVDPFIFFERDGKKCAVFNDLEIDRVKREARLDKILPLNIYVERAKKGLYEDPAAVIYEVLAEHGIAEVEVPRNMSFVIADGLRRKGIKVEAGPSMFFPERYKKTAEEKKKIIDVQKKVFAAMRLVEEIFKRSKIKNGRIIYKGEILTSEKLRTKINLFMIENGLDGGFPIVACGEQTIDPHEHGHGPLKPNAPIIIDIYPRSMKTHYCGDATRTFCKGRAPDALKKMYAVVKKGEEIGIKMAKAGVIGRDIHKSILEFFAKNGYSTGMKDGRNQGFFHGTGHPIGLDVHEGTARINMTEYELEEGNVMSIEPGLYYKGIGGIRIEDLIYVTKTGCDVLAKYPKKLEIC